MTELLLSKDGDHILEGSVSNFFAVNRRVGSDHTSCSVIDYISICYKLIQL